MDYVRTQAYSPSTDNATGCADGAMHAVPTPPTDRSQRPFLDPFDDVILSGPSDEHDNSDADPAGDDALDGDSPADYGEEGEPDCGGPPISLEKCKKGWKRSRKGAHAKGGGGLKNACFCTSCEWDGHGAGACLILREWSLQ